MPLPGSTALSFPFPAGWPPTRGRRPGDFRAVRKRFHPGFRRPSSGDVAEFESTGDPVGVALLCW